jgi:hypothetical protein
MKSRAKTAVLVARNDSTAMNGISLAYCALILWFVLSVAAVSAIAQEDKPVQQSSGPPSTNDVGPVADTIRPYSPAGRDPFRRFVAPKAAAGKNKVDAKAKLLGFPALAVRRAEFQQKVQAAVAQDKPEPEPVMQYLVSELDVTGVFRDDRGYGAFVRAQPTGTTFYVRSGAKLYNGEVLRIENDESDGEGSRVLFREISRLEQNGKQTQQERVLAKSPIRSTGGKSK